MGVAVVCRPSEEACEYLKKRESMPPRKRKQAARKEPEPDPPAAAEAALDPAKMTVAALREELDSRGLETRGKKAELVARLQAELAGSSGPSPTKKSRKGKAKQEPKEEEEV